MVNNSSQSRFTQTKAGDILIVDDTPNNLRFLSDLLSKAGYSVRKTISGEQGLEAAQLEPPDLILLDIKMPGLNGYRVCDQLKSSERTSDIPVIFLSAMDEELDKVMAFEAGGVDYITKPFQVVEVLARIETHLQISRLRQTLKQQNLQLQQEIARRTSAETALDSLSQDGRFSQDSRSRMQQTGRLHPVQAQLQQTERQSLQTQSLADLVEQLSQSLDSLEAALELDLSATQTSLPQQIAAPLASMRQILQTAIPVQNFWLRPVDLLQLCQSFCDQWALPILPHYQLLVLSQGSPSPISVDAILLKQALTQLLNNAIRYSPLGGKLVVQVVYEPTQVLLQVGDEGVGISAARLAQINAALGNLDSSSCDSSSLDSSSCDALLPATPSLGGLSLVKQIAQQHGGWISLSSGGQGTTATLTLPRSA